MRRSPLRALPLLWLLSWTAAAGPLASVAIPGKAVADSRQLPAEIRASCAKKGGMEVLFAVTFTTMDEAEAFFPLSTFEGPDGKAAPLHMKVVAPAGQATESDARSSSGWFGVKNDFLLSLYDAKAWKFVDQVKTAKSVEVSITEANRRLAFTFDNPAEALQKIAKSCR